MAFWYINSDRKTFKVLNKKCKNHEKKTINEIHFKIDHHLGRHVFPIR